MDTVAPPDRDAGRIEGMRSLLRAVLAGAALSVGLGAVAAGCSLGNVSYSECTGDAECATTFGAGSTCSGGFCGAPASCSTGHDCRRQLGGGACVSGVCQSAIPAYSGATLVYPADLMKQPLVGTNAPVVIGGIFALSDPNEVALTQAIRLALSEINQGGLNSGQQLGMIVCDNGGPGNDAMGSARQALDDQALDYLAGTLGVPLILGPLTSADAILLVDELLKQQYPTVIISPSATSPALTSIDKTLPSNDPYPLFWRTCPSDEIQGQVLAEDVIGPVTTIKTVTVIYIDDAYGQGLATVFQSDYGVTSTFLVPFQTSTPGDPTALMELATKANAQDGDAVLLITEAGATSVQIIEAMQGMAITSKPFFFTDGSMDPALLDPSNPAWVQTLLSTAKGTAPASPSGQNFDVFNTDLEAQFDIGASSFSFLAQSYDATYVGAFGLVSALKKGNAYTGIDVAAGMANESAGTPVELNGVGAWDMGKGLMISPGQMNIDGTSGPLDFDAKTGEAPASILVWGIDLATSMFTTIEVVPPP
jgi:branched-chain amino acid transport system substrate-binding protein